MFQRLASAALGCALLLGLSAGPALAAVTDSVTTSVDVVAPALSISVNPTTNTLDFGDMTKGSTTQLGGSFQVTVTDAATASQSTDGWKVMMQPSHLTSGGNTITLGSTKSATVSVLTYEPGTGNIVWTAGAGTGTTNAPVRQSTTASTLLTTGSYYMFRAAAANDSKGTWTGTVPNTYFKLALATNQAVGEYKGTLTLTISRGL